MSSMRNHPPQSDASADDVLSFSSILTHLHDFPVGTWRIFTRHRAPRSSPHFSAVAYVVSAAVVVGAVVVVCAVAIAVDVCADVAAVVVVFTT